MKSLRSPLVLLIVCIGLSAYALVENSGSKVTRVPKEWLKLYYNKDGFTRIDNRLVSELDSIYYTGSLSDGEESTAFLNLASRDKELLTVSLDSVQDICLGTAIPSLYIDTDPFVEEIPNKTDYLSAGFRYIPYGMTADTVINSVSIRGRGNSSWTFPKKSYRLKFDKKQSLGCLKKAKSFVLVPNYIDNTLLRNAVALKIAELLGMPYTNIPQPVNLVFNGKKRGNYLLTNKVGINSGSVDIDETKGILWEIDMQFDEEFKIADTIFYVPLMVKDPDFYEIADNDPLAVAAIWKAWQNDIKTAFLTMKEGRWDEAFDAEQFVKFVLVNTIAQNREILYARSIFMYKEDMNEKYKMGPVWDFDYAFGYNNQIRDGEITDNHFAFLFFNTVFEDEKFLSMFEAELENFSQNLLPKLLSFIDEYAAMIRDSALEDAMIWPAQHFNYNIEGEYERHSARFDENVERLKTWIINRIEGMRNSPNYLLY